jgi:hypothetical protein
MVVSRFCAAFRGYRLLCAAFVIAFGSQSLAQKPEPDPTPPLASNTVQHCKANLNRLFEAIVEYQRVYQTWPRLLSDLHPEFISDLNCFICPAVLDNRTFGAESLRLRDEVFAGPIPTSYTYEFNLKEYPLWAGIASSYRAFKIGQMKIVGSNVPIVRCMEYHQPDLALTVGGGIFETKGIDWEGAKDREELLPHFVFRYLAPYPGRFVEGVPPREPGTDASLIDLSYHYTSGIQTPWLWRNRGHDFSALKLGTIRFKEVPVRFDVRGVTQLTSTNMRSPFPKRADGLPISMRGRYVHFIEGAVQGEISGRRGTLVSGATIGNYEIHYVSGQVVSVPIRYGDDVLVCDDTTNLTTNRARVAWEGLSRPPKSNPRRIRLYYQRWENPRFDDVIQSLDFVSTMAGPAPFLVAVTVEP